LDKEIGRLMIENENLKLRMVEIQHEAEDKERELIGEINKLVTELNNTQNLQDEPFEGDETEDMQERAEALERA
jgi:hypothetical protein